MREGPRESHLLRFLLVAFAVSLLIGVPLLLLAWKTASVFVLGLVYTLLAGVPAWSMIAAAVGAPLSRQVRFAAGLLAFLLAFDLVASLTGWQDLATGSEEIYGALDASLVAAYRLALIASPFITVVLFAGKRPSVFWYRQD